MTGPPTVTGTIAIVLKGYPRLSETFIAQEILALERRGFALRIYSLRHPTVRTGPSPGRSLPSPRFRVT